jgi:hypothetical protein
MLSIFVSISRHFVDSSREKPFCVLSHSRLFVCVCVCVCACACLFVAIVYKEECRLSPTRVVGIYLYKSGWHKQASIHEKRKIAS